MNIYAESIAGLYVLAAIVAAIFLFSLKAGVSVNSNAGRNRTRGLYLIFAGMVLAATVFGAAQGNVSAPSAAVVILAIALIGVTMALVGVGLYLGGAVAARRWRVKLAAALVPLLVVGTGTGAVHVALLQEQAAFRDARAAFLSGTVEATFAGHAVAFPVAPHFGITHPCASRLPATCHSNFLTGTSLNKAPSDGLEIYSFSAMGRSENMLERAEKWCAAQAQQGTIWCSDIPSYRLTLRLSSDVDTTLEFNDWTPLTGTSDGTEIACRNYHYGLTCKLFIPVAPSIIGEAAFSGIPERDVLSLVPQVRQRSQRLWKAMSAG
ncbi:MAG: hypothetical protein AAFY39_00735 [Pseudomonadota bacterium]